MVNSEAFIHRMEKILDHYGLSASSFADQVGVQRSSISHLLSGRNKPSLEFVLKLIGTFPEVDLYWLLHGKGSFPTPGDPLPGKVETTRKGAAPSPDKKGKAIDKIIIFYRDGSFETYNKALN
jgi:transcriptional regulator with XRE-family HTH domain